MSARQPFVPQGHSMVARNDLPQDPAKDANSPHIRYPPVASNPLQAARNASMKKQGNRNSDKFNPSKTNSFSRTQTPGAEPKPRNSFSALRPGSARPSLPQNDNDSYMHAPTPMRSENSHPSLFNDVTVSSTADHGDPSPSASRGKTFQNTESTAEAVAYVHASSVVGHSLALDAHISGSPAIEPHHELQSNRNTSSASSKRVQKRFHTEIDIEDPFSVSVEGQPSPKVRRSIQPRYSRTPPVNSSPPLEHYTQSRYDIQQYQQDLQNGYTHSGSGLRYDRDMMIPPSSPAPQAQQPPGSDALTRLLGRDANVYMEDHMGKYDAAVKKWTNCTIEEWKEGANEMSGKCTKLFDFVKERMESKLKLYAEFSESTDKHKKVLEEREVDLKRVKEGLVKGSGSLLENRFSS